MKYIFLCQIADGVFNEKFMDMKIEIIGYTMDNRKAVIFILAYIEKRACIVICVLFSKQQCPLLDQKVIARKRDDVSRVGVTQRLL